MSYPIDVFIGNKIYNARIDANLSQGELANKMKMTRQMLSKYELGMASLTIQKLCELGQILDKDYNYFYEGYSAGEKLFKKKDNLAILDKDPKLLEIIKIYSRLSPNVRNVVRGLLKSIKSLTNSAEKENTKLSDIQVLSYVRSLRNLSPNARNLVISLTKKLERL